MMPPGRGSVSMRLVFTAAGLFAVVCSVVAGTLLAEYSKAVLDNFALSNGQAQVNTGAAWIRSDINQMVTSANSYGKWIVAQSNRNVSTSAAVLDAFNTSLFSETQTRLQTPGEILGLGFTFLFPSDTGKQTMQSIRSSRDLRQSGAAVEYTYSYTIEDGETNALFLVNVSQPQPTLQAEVRTFNQLKYFLALEEVDDFWDDVFPWVASDNTSFLYLTYQRRFLINGVPLLVQSRQSVQRWYDLLTASLMDANDSSLLVLDRHGHVVATTLLPNLDLKCQFLLSDSAPSWISCVEPPQATPLLQAMSDTASLLPSGQTTVQSKQTLDGIVYFVVVSELINKGRLRLLLVWVRTEDSEMGDVVHIQVGIIVAVCVLIAVISGCVAFFGVLVLLRPIGRLMDEMASIRRLEVNEIRGTHTVPHSRISEIRRLQVEFESMGNVIVSFAKYVPKEVVQDLLGTGAGLAVLGMRQMDITVLFSDMVNFTALCETAGTEAVSELLGQFFADMTRILLNNGATIDKFIGDAIMCFWGAPLECDAPEIRACASALDMRHTVCTLLRPLFSLAGTALDVRIGIHHGMALCGNLGGPDRMSFTAIGDTVNTASRLESLNKHLRTAVLVSHSVFERAMHVFTFRYIGRVVVKGKTQGLQVYELHGLALEEGHTHPMGCRSSMSGESVLTHTRNLLAKHRKQVFSVEESLTHIARKGVTCSPHLRASLERYSTGMRCHDNQDFEAAAALFKQSRLELMSLVNGGKEGALAIGMALHHAEDREAQCRALAKNVPANWTPTLVFQEK